MSDELKTFVPDEQFLTIGEKSFKIWISSKRNLQGLILFNKIQDKESDEHKAIKTDLDFYMAMLDVVFIFIRQDFKITKLFDWIKRQLLTKKYILKNLNLKELQEFVNRALAPIIDSKKKELEIQEKTMETIRLMMDSMGPEVLAKLLENSLQDVDLKKTM